MTQEYTENTVTINQNVGIIQTMVKGMDGLMYHKQYKNHVTTSSMKYQTEWE